LSYLPIPPVKAE